MDRFARWESTTVKVLGAIEFLFAFILILPLMVSIYFGEDISPFITIMPVLLLVGTLQFLLFRESKNFRAVNGLLMVGLAWVLVFGLGMYPYVIAGMNPLDALFESVSGFTTTGATIMADIESWPYGILVWRSMSQWVGGIAIIIIYVGLGLLVTIIFGASALNSLSTSAVANLIFFAILVIFALSFFGLFEITLPASWSNAMNSKSSSTTGFLSILFMAFTLVLVSFSCTGPIIGTLLVEAASGNSWVAPAIGMFGFAFALALPFSLFAMFPSALKKMPKSGGWMHSFKVILAFIELALSLKFLSVADMAYGWGILPRWLFLLLWIIIFFAMGVFLVWKIWEVNKVRMALRIILIALSWGFTAYLIPGLWGAPVKAVSAFAPPMPIEDREVFYDYEEGLAYAKQEGKPVLLDFTGYGCVNCRKMEAYVLSDETVKERLKAYVLIELYVDDKNDGIGEKNSKIQREIYGANAQPYYIQLDKNGQKISQPYAFSIDPQEFLDWLQY